VYRHVSREESAGKPFRSNAVKTKAYGIIWLPHTVVGLPVTAATGHSTRWRFKDMNVEILATDSSQIDGIAANGEPLWRARHMCSA
jgi:hypothetical protein